MSSSDLNITKKVAKVGISGQKLNKNGQSPRANRQVNVFNKTAEPNVRYEAKVIKKNISNRAEALEWERKMAKKIKDNVGYRMTKHKYP